LAVAEVLARPLATGLEEVFELVGRKVPGWRRAGRQDGQQAVPALIMEA
jgi:hypothetical protein